MWCRSQGGKNLTDGIIIYRVSDENEIRLENIGVGTSYIIAKYSTPEKAMKVMDMLEEHINNSNCWFGKTSSSPTFQGEICTQQQKVFKFPLDEEVKL